MTRLDMAYILSFQEFGDTWRFGASDLLGGYVQKLDRNINLMIYIIIFILACCLFCFRQTTVLLKILETWIILEYLYDDEFYNPSTSYKSRYLRPASYDFSRPLFFHTYHTYIQRERYIERGKRGTNLTYSFFYYSRRDMISIIIIDLLDIKTIVLL
jgi:hypothetical protein